MTITVLADNTVVSRHALGEHGLAVWIDTGELCLLFDTGQGRALAENARALRSDLDAVDTIVLSHGHYDHAGGLADVVRVAACPVTVHAHPDVLAPKYQRVEAGPREIGLPAESRQALADAHCRFIASRGPVEIGPGIWTTGEIPRVHPEEEAAEPFFRDAEGEEADRLLDDQALFVETSGGTVVLLGCAHAGPINTLDHIRTLTDGRPVRAVLGGMHLRMASEARIEWTVRELRRFDIGLLAPMHCTGAKAIAELWSAFPAACRPAGAGSRWEFERERGTA